MSESERKIIDNTLAFHSAPTLLGVKCANLISFDTHEQTIAEYLDETGDKLVENGLSAVQLCKCRARTLVYIYNEKMLTAWLSMPQVSDFLAEYGYTEDMSIVEKLRRLATRMRQTFDEYDRCRNILFDRLNHGLELFQAVK